MTAPVEYWFARRFPVGDRRSAYAPVHWKGWLATSIYLAVLLIGGGAFVWMGATGAPIQGAVAFAVAALVGAGWFITVANAKGDKTRTVADYKKEASRV